MDNPETNLESRALLWSITAGIVLILGVMLAITGLLVHYNRHAIQRQSYQGPYDITRRDRKRNPHPGKLAGKQGKTMEDVYLNPRTDLRRSRPQMPGKRPPTPTSSNGDSDSRSFAEHIYDVPECVVYDNPNETVSFGSLKAKSDTGSK